MYLIDVLNLKEINIQEGYFHEVEDNTKKIR